MALFCYSFLVNAFENVVCLPIRDLPYDFHKGVLGKPQRIASQSSEKFHSVHEHLSLSERC